MKHTFKLGGNDYRLDYRKDGPVMYVTLTAPERLYHAKAVCSPSDRFDRLKGRKIATGRALRQSFKTKEVRRRIWEQLLDE